MPFPQPLPPADLDQILARTGPLWQELQGEQVFLTGGSGFIGSWMVESFCAVQERLRLRARLWLLLRDPEAWRSGFPHLADHPALRILPGDLAGLRPSGGAFHGVIHAATIAQDAPYAYLRQTLDGACRVLDFAAAAGAKRLLFTSSGAVYGSAPEAGVPIPEDCLQGPRPEEPATAYGHAKRTAEGLFSAYAAQQGAAAVLARCFAFVGPRLKLDANFAIGNFIRDALRGEAILVRGDGTPLRSYLYASDLAVWLWTLYFRGPSACPVNVGSDQAISIAALAARVAAVVAPAVPVREAGRAEPGRPPHCYVPVTGRAADLGLAPWTGLDEGIRRTAEWYRKEGLPA